MPVAPWLVVEGVGSGDPVVADRVTVLVWVEADDELRLARGLERDGELEPSSGGSSWPTRGSSSARPDVGAGRRAGRRDGHAADRSCVRRVGLADEPSGDSTRSRWRLPRPSSPRAGGTADAVPRRPRRRRVRRGRDVPVRWTPCHVRWPNRLGREKYLGGVEKKQQLPLTEPSPDASPWLPLVRVDAAECSASSGDADLPPEGNGAERADPRTLRPGDQVALRRRSS